MLKTLRGLGVTLTGDFPDVPHIVAAIPMTTTHGIVGFKFVDCIATYVNEELDPLHPDGYGTVDVNKYGERTGQYSQVIGMLGGAMEVVVYPAQFGIPCEWGTHYYFHAGPSAILTACVEAVRKHLHPCDPEYAI